MSPAPLRVQALGHRFGTTPVLDDLSLTVEPGEVVALLGPSGVGKTTLLRAIAGLLLPEQGSIWLGGEAVVEQGVERVPTERRRVGLVFQDYALFPHLDVAANIAFGMPRPVDEGRVAALLALTGLDGLAARRPHALSGGQQQRVAVARALATEPALLLLDEPFANVDPALRLALGERLAALIRAAGTAALLITHSREEALGLADRVVVLAPSAGGGRRAQLGTPEEVYRRPVSAVVAGLTGPVATVAGERRGAVLHTPLGDWPVEAGAPDRAQTAIVRPESLELCGGSFPVLRRRWSPPQWLVQVETPAGPLWVEAAEQPQADTVGLRPRGPLWAVVSE